MLRLLAQLLPYSRRKDEINERMLKKESLLVQNHTFLSQLVRFVFPFLIKVLLFLSVLLETLEHFYCF